MGEKGPHTKHISNVTENSVTAMFVFIQLSTIFWYVGPLKETQAKVYKVTFLLILHPLSLVLINGFLDLESDKASSSIWRKNLPA